MTDAPPTLDSIITSSPVDNVPPHDSSLTHLPPGTYESDILTIIHHHSDTNKPP
eukprot:CAMPEP_0198262542 /NCGR_PEP_ID=MMETSP1447-20131203/11039_1 /TAXON_ID=420782 /ORGANISM="Chaetoceros dichaeta, Strain CCMP1751" /LENGTH=53 /DNA_ID=CAMNT_0043950819 /DNA_START=37 /DNA_END=195 /DNA_ORIENTATION=+